MFQRKGIILEGGVPVRLRQMPGIAGFGKKTQVGEFEPLDHFPLLLKNRAVRPLLDGGVDKNQGKKQDIPCQKNQKQMGFSHIIRPALLSFRQLPL
jgi:hypothetical protein